MNKLFKPAIIEDKMINAGDQVHIKFAINRIYTPENINRKTYNKPIQKVENDIQRHFKKSFQEKVLFLFYKHWCFFSVLSTNLIHTVDFFSKSVDFNNNVFWAIIGQP